MLAEQIATTEMAQQIQLAKLQPEVWLNQTSRQTVLDLQQLELAQVLLSTAAAIQSFAKIRSVVHFWTATDFAFVPAAAAVVWIEFAATAATTNARVGH